jgi:hypothetical protein
MKHIVTYKMFENNNITYYHGSYDLLEDGTILKAHDKSYTRQNDNSYLEKIMEKYRPEDKISRYDAIFLSDDIDSIDAAGGSLDYVYSVEPIGEIQKSDLAWYTEIQMTDDENLQKEYAENYWNGVPFYDKDIRCWEYRVKSARIIELEEEN